MATETLTDRQRQVFDFIVEYKREHGVPPTMKEIGDALGIASKSTTHQHVTALVAKGYLAPRLMRGQNVYWPVEQS